MLFQLQLQEMRDTRLRAGCVRTELTLSKLNAANSNVTCFSAEKKRKIAADAKAVPRFLALDLMRAWHNMMCSLGSGFDYSTEEEYDKLFANGEVPRILVLCMDQMQSQWCAYYYLGRAPSLLQLWPGLGLTTGDRTTYGER